MACLQEGLFPPEPPRSSAGTAAHPNEVGFSNGLLESGDIKKRLKQLEEKLLARQEPLS